MTYRTRICMLTMGGAFAVLVSSCNTDLNVTNPNAPNTERAISNANDVENLVGSAFNTWFNVTQGVYGPLAVATASDNLTSGFGNFAMRFTNMEPRIAYRNTTSLVEDSRVASDQWEQNYSAAGASVDALNAIKGGVVINSANETEAVKAFAYLMLGATIGNIGMYFDRGVLVDENFVRGGRTGAEAEALLKPYAEVSALALKQYDAAIALAAGKPWSIPPAFTPGTALTADNFARLANTMAARQLVFTPRTTTENAAVDWAKVLAYADKGISSTTAPGSAFDFSILGDGEVTRADEVKDFGEAFSWTRADQRIVQLLDPSQPVVFTSQTPPPRAGSNPAITDNRLYSDFTFVQALRFDPARGVWNFSNWSHKRYSFYSFDYGDEALAVAPILIQAENDLLIAEALVRTGGDKNRAATLINNTRVTRGNRPALTAGNTNAEFLAAIFYERDIELMNVGGGQPFFDRRRIDAGLVTSEGINIGAGLQTGTFRHLPIPAKEMETYGLPVYTYGGATADPTGLVRH